MGAGTEQVCIDCGEVFDILEMAVDMETCVVCGWITCPHCGGCICTIHPKAKVAAIAVWLSENAGTGLIPEETKEGWLKFIKLLARPR